MLVELERRPIPSRVMTLLSPVIAVALTLATAALLLALDRVNPLEGLYVYFLQPLTVGWSLTELAVKASPLILIAIGLSVCFLANLWNIGAEGQYIAGAMLGGWFALAFHTTGAWWVLPAMLVLGALGGMLYALIPALLRVRFGASEILTSLMLVYVAQLALDYLVRGPWRDPQGYNFPQSVNFEEAATIPLMLSGGRLHWGVLLAPLAVILAFAVSGALAGLAGIIEVAGPIGQLLPTISPGYGFSAIIVAFLGRLNPIGIFLAGLFLALSYLGGEAAQIALRVPLDLTNVLQGVLLFYVLACDTLILYRPRVKRPRWVRHAA